MLDASDLVVLAGAVAALGDGLGQPFVEDVVHQGALAAAGHAGDAAQQPQGELHVDALEVVLPRAFALKWRFSLPLRRTSGVGMRLRPLRYAPVSEASLAITSETLPVATMWPPCSPAPGPRSTMWSAARIMASSCSTTITGVAHVPQASQRADEAVVVVGMQADGGFVAHVEHAGQSAADLSGEADALGFSAGQGASCAAHGHVVQADAVQEVQAALYLLEYLIGDDHFPHS